MVALRKDTKLKNIGATMKSLIFTFFITLLFGLSAQAFESQEKNFVEQTEKNFSPSDRFQCVTEFPTTSFFFMPAGDEKTHNLRVIHHNGLKYAPIHSGIITLNDLPNLLTKGELLAQAGTSFEIPFDSENCRYIEENEMVCYQRNEATVGELDVRAYSLHSYIRKSRLFEQSYTQHVVSLSFSVGNRSYDITMDYTPNDCQFSF